VTNRDRSIFARNYLSTRQLDDDIAIVSIDGKEQYFDPGSRYCPYGHLAWKHGAASGLRQAESGVVIASTPNEDYTYSKLQRIADLTMDQSGVVTGTVNFTYYGAPALRWRQAALTGDEISVSRDLRTSVERLLPGGMEVKVSKISNLFDYEKPLIAVFDVKGPIGSPTGKRLLIAGDLFEENTRPLFSHPKRELAVFFDYGRMVQDVVRVTFPSSFAIESLPAKIVDKLDTGVAYSMATEQTPTSFIVRRNYSLGGIVFLPTEYPALRSFYAKMQTKDQEPVVITRATLDSGK
jgi:hypothetical protein